MNLDVRTGNTSLLEDVLQALISTALDRDTYRPRKTDDRYGCDHHEDIELSPAD